MIDKMTNAVTVLDVVANAYEIANGSDPETAFGDWISDLACEDQCDGTNLVYERSEELIANVVDGVEGDLLAAPEETRSQILKVHQYFWKGKLLRRLAAELVEARYNQQTPVGAC